MLKEFLIVKGLGIAFKTGLKGDLPERVAVEIEKNLDKQIGEVMSEKTQEDFEYFLIEFIGRVIKTLRKDRGAEEYH